MQWFPLQWRGQHTSAGDFGEWWHCELQSMTVTAHACTQVWRSATTTHGINVGPGPTVLCAIAFCSRRQIELTTAKPLHWLRNLSLYYNFRCNPLSLLLISVTSGCIKSRWPKYDARLTCDYENCKSPRSTELPRGSRTCGSQSNFRIGTDNTYTSVHKT